MTQPAATKIAEIDITRPSRALAVLRLTDYMLVFGCGFAAVGAVPELAAAEDWLGAAIMFAAMAVFSFAAWTGWRNVGVIDPRIWRQ